MVEYCPNCGATLIKPAHKEAPLIQIGTIPGIVRGTRRGTLQKRLYERFWFGAIFAEFELFCDSCGAIIITPVKIATALGKRR